MLLIQKHLRSNPLSSLDEYGISVKRHDDFPNLCFLKYSQIDSPMGNPMVQECRGIILDEANDWAVVSYPFNKFFNYGEGNAAEIDWKSATVYEKLDGSLMTLYYYKDWQVASNGTPDAGGGVSGSEMTFEELFWSTYLLEDYNLPRDMDYCYIFELMTPYNRVVVPHQDSKLVLIGCRDLRSLCEIEPSGIAKQNGWECVKSFPLTSISECIESASKLRAMEQEGYVVCDSRFNRVKVKSPQYVALSHIKDNFSARRMLEIIRANETDEFLVYFPEMKPLYNKILDRWSSVCADLEQAYAKIKHIESQKEFALLANQTECSSVLFSMRSGKVQSATEFFRECTLSACERVMLKGIESI